jgi:hypothetical protein
LREGWHAQRSDTLSYEDWIKAFEAPQRPPAVRADGHNPLISIVVPAFNTPDKYLNPLLDSIIEQSYTNWELVLVQASTVAERAEAIRLAAKRDQRIKIVELEKNEGIAGNTNVGLQNAKGHFIAFLDHDDTLSPYALASVVEALQAEPKIGLFYSDEDKVSDDGIYRSLPLFKPAWSPELFLGVNYLAHFVVVRTDLVRQVGGIRLGYDGAQDYDFLLRVTGLSPVIHAISRMSYHWRQAAGSTGLDLGEKSYANDAGLRAMSDYVQRNKIEAEVTQVEGRPTEYRLKYRVVGQPSVAVLPTGLHSPEAYARLMKKTAYPHCRLIADASEASNDELLLQIDLALEPSSPDWLTELIGLAQQPDIAWAGACLVTSDGRSCGIGYTEQQGAWEPIFSGLALEQWTLMGPAVWPRNVMAPNASCALIEVKKLKALGGNDLNISALYASTNGMRNVYWPYARLTGSKLMEVLPLRPAFPGNTQDPNVNSNLAVKNGDFLLKKQKQ